MKARELSNSNFDPVRRAMMIAIAGLASGVVGAKAIGRKNAEHAAARSLVVYFSRSGNTRVVAGLIHRATSSDLFEIRAASPYPEDYLATVEQARQERDSGFEPALDGTVSSLSTYDTVYLGFPIWGETTPPVIRSFLKQHDLSGRTVFPFITHGGYGLGNSLSILSSHAPKARLLGGFSMQADQERQTMERVDDWLAQLKNH